MVSLIPLRTGDGNILEQIHAACFPDAWDRQTFDRLLTEHPTCGWIASSLEGVPAGFILARILEDEGEILTFAVHPSYQKTGIGRHLLRGLLNFLESMGCVRIFLEVALDNKAAIALYASQGFIVMGTRPNYYKRENQAAVCAFAMAWTKRNK